MLSSLPSFRGYSTCAGQSKVLELEHGERCSSISRWSADRSGRRARVGSAEPRAFARVGACRGRRSAVDVVLATSVDPRSGDGVDAQPISLCSGFFHRAAESPERAALEVAGRTIPYGELARRARAIASTLLQHTGKVGPPLTAVLAQRSATAFAGVLGVLARGHGYVPLSPGLPPARNRAILDRSGCEAVIVDSVATPQVSTLVAGLDRELLFVLPDGEDAEQCARQWAPHRVVGAHELG